MPTLICVQCRLAKNAYWKFDPVQRREPAPVCKTCSCASAQRLCTACQKYLPSHNFTQTQIFKHGTKARCRECVRLGNPAQSWPAMAATPVSPSNSLYLYKIMGAWNDPDTIN